MQLYSYIVVLLQFQFPSLGLDRKDAHIIIVQQLDLCEFMGFYYLCTKWVNVKETNESKKKKNTCRRMGCQWLGKVCLVIRVSSQMDLRSWSSSMGRHSQRPRSCQPCFGLSWISSMTLRASCRLFGFLLFGGLLWALVHWLRCMKCCANVSI